MLENGIHDVPAGKVSAVVTHLEMLAPAAPRPVPECDGLELRRVEAPGVDWYRGLFRAVGAVDWLWFSRLVMPEAELETIITDPSTQVFALFQNSEECGLLELDFRTEGECELAFFGISPALIGGGVGRWMMNRAIALAWEAPIRRFHLHTCTLDHPAARAFYIRSGFVPYRQQIEVADDPRLSGVLPPDSAPQVPIFGK